MDANTKKRYDKAGPQVVKALEKRHFEAYYVSTAAEAVEKVVELIPKEHTVSWGGTATMDALGIKQRLAQEGIELQYLENDEDIPEIPCDTSRMRQVFLNLLDNAAKHGGEGGKITAEICMDGGDVVIRIRDFGPGIPEEELPLVKKKFYKGSSKARGSGIGLAVCEEIVTMHNGTLTLENAEGGGTLVTIRMPAADT